jgi:hypothetical protein
MGQTFPAPIASATLVVANANFDKPRYTAAGAADWAGGVVVGEDPGLSHAANQAARTANAALANASGGAARADYAPRTQWAKGQTAGQAATVEVNTPRGMVEPDERYPVAGDAAEAAPVVTSLLPSTAAAGSQPLTVTITGTGFTPYSRVITGGTGSPFDAEAKYLSATTMTVVIDPRGAVAGTISVAVEDHGVLSNTSVLFTFT